MIDILMATYNGAAYLEEQLQSLVEQTYTDWRCIVHDDGSTDETTSILQRWTNRDNRIVWIQDEQHGMGVAQHFIYLLSFATSPWVMWADQDDVWWPEKIEKMLKKAEEAHFKGAGVVYSNAQLWNEEQGVIAPRNTLYYPTQIRHTLFLNTGIQGSAALFNQAMCEILKEPLTCYAMHDHVLLLAALTMGEIVYMDEPLMYYRQHAQNVTGNQPGSMRRKVMQQWTNRHIPLVSQLHLDGLKAFYAQHQQHIKEEDRQQIETFIALPEMSAFVRLKTIREMHYTLFGSEWLLWIKYCIRRYI